MPHDNPGLRYLRNVKLGMAELDWWQDEIAERQAWARIGSSHELGWVGQYIGPAFNFGWELYEQSGGVLYTRSTGSDGTPLYFDRTRPNEARPVLGIDRAGRVLEQPIGTGLLDAADDELVIPNDGTWYTLVANYRVRVREPGTLTLTGGGTTVTGVGTQFTRYTDGSYAGGPMLVRIDAGDTVQGNEGTYTIDEIVSDTEMTLVTAPPVTETGVEFRIKGQFLGQVPADPDVHANTQITWSLITRTTERPTTGLIAADVRRSSGTLTVIDRRRANLFRPLVEASKTTTLVHGGLMWNNVDATPAGGPGDSTVVYQQVQRYEIAAAQAAQHKVVGMSACMASVGSHITGIAADHPTGMMMAAIWEDGASASNIRVLHHSPTGIGGRADGTVFSDGWHNPDGGSAVNAASGAVGDFLDVALLAVPAGSGATHLLFYVEAAGNVLLKSSSNNGATWGSATTILNPTSTNTVSRISAVLTRMNRIIVACAWSTGNRIRYIYSDDLGATWDTNSTVGYSSAVANEAVEDVSIVQDTLGNLWTVGFVDGAAPGLRIYRGQTERNPVPSTTEMPTANGGWKAGAAFADPGEMHTGDAIATADGSLLVVYAVEPASGAAVGQVKRILLSQVIRQYTVHTQALVYNPQSATSLSIDTAICAAVTPNGGVLLGWGNAFTTNTGADYNLHLCASWYWPHEVPRSLAPWIGGV